jgi:hypothetical protein
VSLAAKLGSRERLKVRSAQAVWLQFVARQTGLSGISCAAERFN